MINQQIPMHRWRSGRVWAFVALVAAVVLLAWTGIALLLERAEARASSGADGAS